MHTSIIRPAATALRLARIAAEENNCATQSELEDLRELAAILSPDPRVVARFAATALRLAHVARREAGCTLSDLDDLTALRSLISLYGA